MMFLRKELFEMGIDPRGVLGPIGMDQGSFLRLHVARKHQKQFPCYKRYQNSRIFLDEKAKYQPWIIKKPKFG
jgi:hypothetical protein